MAGTARVMFGLLLVVVGPFLLLTPVGFVFGILLLLLGLFLLVSGIRASGVRGRIHEWRDLPRLIVPPSTTAGAPPVAPAPSGTEETPPATDASTPPKFCPACGQGNARAAAFCVKCGKPLPPPS